ncbi:MAG TPA: inositol-3-phosphate synthase [Methylomirabilota bacterium]|nr:inositol-3-phosphate synthase [Methylomirabilota bacterium]
MSTVNVGVVGVGNCASSLVQGVEYYSTTGPGRAGLTNPVCAGYAVPAVRFTSAFDVNASKIDRDLSEAIWAAPNNALRFADVPRLGVQVREGILSDGVGHHSAERIDARGRATLDDIVEHLRLTATQVVVNFLPVGSQRASELYAETAVRAGCAFVNCIPSVIARSADWARAFEHAGLPLIGDDLKSQFGATLVHHALVDVLSRNGVRLRNTYQIVSGGNMDFLNMQDPDRVESKKTSKVQGLGGVELPAARVHFGAEYVPFLDDRKIAFIRLEGEAFGGTPLELELRMCVEDSPSAAGNVLDAVRYMKLALDRGIAGVVDPVSSLLMKATPRPLSEAAALAALRALIDR